MVIVCAGVDDDAVEGGVNAEIADDEADKFKPPISEDEFCCCAATKCRYGLWSNAWLDDGIDEELWYKLCDSSEFALQSLWMDSSELHNL